MADLEQRLAALESKLLEVQDHLAVLQVVARYGPLVDSTLSPEQRLKAGSLWAEDGVYNLAPGRDYVGPQGVADMLVNPIHQSYLDSGSAHISMLPYVLLDGDRATALGYTQVVQHNDGGYDIARLSINYWELARRNGEWKVLRRTNRLLTASEQSHALMRLADNTSLADQ